MEEEKDWIKKEDMENFCIYSCNARNFNYGIWFDGKMFGLRSKFGDTFLFYEMHWDDGEPHGTCKPIKKLSSSLKHRLHPSMFDLSNWRGNVVVEDILYTAAAIFDYEIENA